MTRAAENLLAWRLMTIEPDGQQCTTYAAKTPEGAQEWARGLYGVGTKLVVLIGSDGEIMIADEILEWCRRKSSSNWP